MASAVLQLLLIVFLVVAGMVGLFMQIPFSGWVLAAGIAVMLL